MSASRRRSFIRRLSTGVACALGFALTAIYPAQAGDLFERGKILYNQRQYAAAAELFKQATATDNRNPDVYYYYALSLQNAGEMARARDTYMVAVKYFPGTAVAYNANKAIQMIDQYYPGAKNGMLIVAPKKLSEPISVPTQSYLTPLRARGQDQMPDSLVIPFEPRNGLMIVDLIINGRAAKFCFDTGSETVAIGKNQLTALGLPLPKGAPKTVARGVGDQGAQPVWETNMDLRLGSMDRRQFPVQVQEQMDVGPLLGLSFYRDYTYTIDSGAKVLRLQKRTKVATSLKPVAPVTGSDPYAVPFVRTGHEPLVNVMVNGKILTMVFDTGAMGVSITEEQCKSIGLTIPDDAPVVAAKGIQGATTARVITIDSIKLGPIERQNFTVHVFASPKGGIGLIGQTLLDGYSYTVDHEAGVIRFAHR